MSRLGCSPSGSGQNSRLGHLCFSHQLYLPRFRSQSRRRTLARAQGQITRLDAVCYDIPRRSLDIMALQHRRRGLIRQTHLARGNSSRVRAVSRSLPFETLKFNWALFRAKNLKNRRFYKRLSRKKSGISRPTYDFLILYSQIVRKHL